MHQAPDQNANGLLASMPPDDWARIAPHLEIFDLPLGKVLYESGCAMGHVYFPINAIVSLLYVMEDGASAEIAVVGHEGIVGIALFMGGETTPSRAVVQSAGLAWRLSARAVREERANSPAVLRVMLGYVQAMLGQVAQTAACNRYHSIDQLLCPIEGWNHFKKTVELLLKTNPSHRNRLLW
jgi:CRP-like cAMP-binding protein